ncbi:MAG: thiol peroxidase [Thermodesulfobacteriota bacterium]
MPTERAGSMTLKGGPITLVGDEIKVGDKAPEFTTLEGLGAPVTLADLGDKIKVFSVVLSIDTPVCDAQTKRFNEEAADLGDDVAILTISVDLPFAAKRYCGAEGIDKIKVVSDYRDTSFGEAYGILIKEHRLLGRGIFVVDRDNTVKYVEYVHEITEHPNYDAALEAVRGLL